MMDDPSFFWGSVRGWGWSDFKPQKCVLYSNAAAAEERAGARIQRSNRATLKGINDLDLFLSQFLAPIRKEATPIHLKQEEATPILN
jgi:hypothetical protein